MMSEHVIVLKGLERHAYEVENFKTTLQIGQHKYLHHAVLYRLINSKESETIFNLLDPLHSPCWSTW